MLVSPLFRPAEFIGFAVCAPKVDKINSNCDTLAPRFARTFCPVCPRKNIAKSTF
jgi:hypothetical protein